MKLELVAHLFERGQHRAVVGGLPRAAQVGGREAVDVALGGAAAELHHRIEARGFDAGDEARAIDRGEERVHRLGRQLQLVETQRGDLADDRAAFGGGDRFGDLAARVGGEHEEQVIDGGLQARCVGDVAHLRDVGGDRVLVGVGHVARKRIGVGGAGGAHDDEHEDDGAFERGGETKAHDATSCVGDSEVRTCVPLVGSAAFAVMLVGVVLVVALSGDTTVGAVLVVALIGVALVGDVLVSLVDLALDSRARRISTLVIGPRR